MSINQNTICPLCRLTNDGEILTRRVAEDDLLLIVDCQVCRVPMAVLKTHRAIFTEEEQEHIRGVFRDLLATTPIPLTEDAYRFWKSVLMTDSDELIWVIDWEQRRIPDHAHCHLRPRPFPGTTKWEKI